MTQSIQFFMNCPCCDGTHEVELWIINGVKTPSLAFWESKHGISSQHWWTIFTILYASYKRCVSFFRTHHKHCVIFSWLINFTGSTPIIIVITLSTPLYVMRLVIYAWSLQINVIQCIVQSSTKLLCSLNL